MPNERRRAARTAVTAAAGAWLVRAVGVTWRVTFEGSAHVAEARRGGRGVAFALWHGELLPVLWAHRGWDVHALVSTHRDGEIIARVTHALGLRTVRGSSTRGGAGALRAMMRLLAEGRDVAVTPDGPRGPRHSVAPGLVLAAQRAAAALLPVRATVSRAWRLRSWDRFTVPKPFARIVVRYGAPIEPGTGTPTADEAARLADRVAAAMRALVPNDD
jgi:lysophospholipid acyltransferase (LPLAT)-like uncharacterized protein